MAVQWPAFGSARPDEDGGSNIERLPVAAALGSSTAATAVADTWEERELRRQNAQRVLQEALPPSRIESDYLARTGGGSLQQFGYDLLRRSSGASGSVTGPIDDSYILDKGDELVIRFTGERVFSQSLRINRKGQLFPAGLLPIAAAGRTFGSVRIEVEEATRRQNAGQSAFVSLGSIRQVKVFVGGEVEQPGEYIMTGLSGVVDAVSQAGGIRKSGTLRNLRIFRGGKTLSVDLYGLLGIGSPRSVQVRDGDRIIVPPLGNTVAVVGSVVRPGVYEVRGSTSVADILAHAGGPIRRQGSKLSIRRIGASGREQFQSVPALGLQMQAGDVLSVVDGRPGGTTGTVELRGAVANPGRRSLASYGSVLSLLSSIDNLPGDAYLPLAVLKRHDLNTGSRTYQAVDLVDVRGGRDVYLQDGDQLYVIDQAAVAFLSSVSVRAVVLGEANPVPACSALTHLEELVRDNQTSRFTIVNRGFMGAEKGVRRDSVSSEDPQGIAGSVMSGGHTAAGCPKVLEDAPEFLPFLIESAVSVGGAVARPGIYPVAGGSSPWDLASLAGGILPGAAEIRLDLMRIRDTDVTHEGVPVIDPQAMKSIVVRSGEDIRFSAAFPPSEPGGVLLTGEFERPGLYSIRKGETLSQLVARAGGLTGLAYPYGAIFTRQSVKVAQQENMRRVTRDLRVGMLALGALKDKHGAEPGAREQALQQLEKVPVTGRLVIEADTQVLARRPELDPVLESGDAIFMPKQGRFVLALGDVASPGALPFSEGLTAKDYIQLSGGLGKSADRKYGFVVLPDGRAVALSSNAAQMPLPPGSTVAIPTNLDPLQSLGTASDITGIVRSLIMSVATIAIMATN